MFEELLPVWGVRRIIMLRWRKGNDSDRVTGLNRDDWLVGHRKIPAVQWARLPRYGREGAVEVRPFPAETKLWASLAQGLSGEAVKGNPTTTVILGVDESKPGLSNNRRLDRISNNLYRSPALLPGHITEMCPIVFGLV
jgi:hypothetical protein